MSRADSEWADAAGTRLAARIGGIEIHVRQPVSTFIVAPTPGPAVILILQMKTQSFLLSLVISIGIASAQSSSFGYSNANPVSSTLSHLQSESFNSRLIYRVGLKRKGYTDAQLGQMTTEELRIAYLGGKVPGKPPARKPSVEKTSMPPATKFKPTSKRILMPRIVDSLTEDASHRKALKDLFSEQLNAYDAEAKREGFQNDIAGAIAFFAGVAFHLQDGAEISDASVKVLARAIQVGMDTPAVRKVSDKEKQEFHEFMVTMGSYLLVASKEVDADTRAQLRQVSADVLKKFTGIDPQKVRLTGDGLEKRS